jgi:hypothetical protein
MDGMVVEAPPGAFVHGRGEFLSGSVGSSFVVSVFADRRNASADYEI